MKKYALLAGVLATQLAAAIVGDAIGTSIRIANAQEPGATAASVVRIDPRTDEVFIDWRLVALTAKGKGPAAEQPILVAAAKIMIAVRDKTWKPMPK